MNGRIALKWIAGLMIASSLNCAAANLLIIIWRIELFYYLPMVFMLSVMIGALLLSISKSIICAYSSMIGGLIIASTIFLAPYLIFAEDVVRFNIAATVLFSFLSKVFLVSVVLYFLGAILGCILGRRILGQH